MLPRSLFFPIVYCVFAADTFLSLSLSLSRYPIATARRLVSLAACICHLASPQSLGKSPVPESADAFFAERRREARATSSASLGRSASLPHQMDEEGLLAMLQLMSLQERGRGGRSGGRRGRGATSPSLDELVMREAMRLSLQTAEQEAASRDQDESGRSPAPGQD